MKTSGWFASPVKQLPSVWQLFEYYAEPSGELIHIQENKLKEENRFWEIELNEDGSFAHSCNLDIPLISGINDGTWRRNRNFIVFSGKEGLQMSIGFQFAVEKGILKLLKKNKQGGIEIFGFFRVKK